MTPNSTSSSSPEFKDLYDQEGNAKENFKAAVRETIRAG